VSGELQIIAAAENDYLLASTLLHSILKQAVERLMLGSSVPPSSSDLRKFADARNRLYKLLSRLPSEKMGAKPVGELVLWRIGPCPLTRVADLQQALEIALANGWTTESAKAQLLKPFARRVEGRKRWFNRLRSKFLPKLNQLESDIVEVLGSDHMTRAEIAVRLEDRGYSDNSHLKSTLSAMVKRGVLSNVRGKGYLNPARARP
jgi:hypothetical protein